MSERIAITGNQLLCALGTDPTTAAQRLIDKQSGLKEYLFADLEASTPSRFGEVSFDLKKELGGKGWRHHNRASLMACLLARKQLGHKNDPMQFEHEPEQLGIVLGYNHDVFSPGVIEPIKTRSMVNMNPGHFLTMSINSVAAQVSILNKIQGLGITHTTGWIAGLEALHTAAHFLQTDRVQRILAGGVEEGLLETIYSMATAFQTQAYNGNATIQLGEPNAIPAGEGCALLHLEKETQALNAGRQPVAYMLGFGMGIQKKAASAGDASAVVQAMTNALAQAELAAEEVDAVFLSANGNVVQDQTEAKAIHQVFSGKCPTAVALKGALGDTFHASGAIAVSLACACAQLKTIPPTLLLTEPHPEYPLNTSANARPWSARYAMVLTLDRDQKAGALILEFPRVGGTQ
jgi:3-oxoacyl-(acyl-carrier-protein) synthase